MPRRPRKYRLWTTEEKRSICQQTTAPGVSVAQVARRYSMNANLIFKWLKDPRYTPDRSVADATVFLPVEIATSSSEDADLQPDTAEMPGLPNAVASPLLGAR